MYMVALPTYLLAGRENFLFRVFLLQERFNVKSFIQK